MSYYIIQCMVLAKKGARIYMAEYSSGQATNLYDLGNEPGSRSYHLP